MEQLSGVDVTEFYKWVYEQYADLDIPAGEYSPCEMGPSEVGAICRLEPPTGDGLANVKHEQARSMWSAFSSGVLMEDALYGQSGLKIYAPVEALRATADRLDFDERFNGGDLILGEFLGGPDLLFLNDDDVCVVANEYASRSDWTEFKSMENLFRAFLYCQGWQVWDYRGWDERAWRVMPTPGRKYSIEEGFLD